MLLIPKPHFWIYIFNFFKRIDVASVTVWERAVHSVYCACLSWAFVKFCVCPSFPFGIEGRMWVVIVLIPDHYLSIYFTSLSILTNVYS